MVRADTAVTYSLFPLNLVELTIHKTLMPGESLDTGDTASTCASDTPLRDHVSIRRETSYFDLQAAGRGGGA